MILRISVSRMGGIFDWCQVSGVRGEGSNNEELYGGRKPAVGGQEDEIEVCYGPRGVSMGLWETRESQEG